MPASKAFNPNDIYNPEKSSGTTQTPSGLITDVVLTGKLQFKDGSVVTGVSQDFRENQYDSCPSSFALFQGLSVLDSNIKAIDPNNNFFRDNTVISMPLINSTFSTPWEIDGNWSIVDGQAIYAGDNRDNWLKIPSEAIPFVGYYYLNVVVDRLDSGLVQIYDHADNLVTTITTHGEYNVEMYIANSDITTFRIVAENVFQGDYINVSYVGFHRVTDRFRDYFMHLLRNQGIGGGGGVDLVEVQKLISKAVSDLRVSLELLISEVNDALLVHLNERGNVHNLTLTDIRAAAVDHTHVEFGNYLSDLLLLLAHASDRETNPHGITPVMIGAADTLHHHALTEIGTTGAAAANHDHDDLYLALSEKQTILEAIPSIVKPLIDAALSAITNSGKNYSPFIVVPPEIGIDVIGAEDSIITEPAITVLTPNIIHQSDSDYDYYSGLAGCNRKLINEESAAKAFSDYFGLVATFKETTTTPKLTILTYKFHTTREISGYQITKDHSNSVKGFVTEWEMYIDGKLVDSVTDPTWTTLSTKSTSAKHTATFTAVSGHEIKFVISDVSMDPVALNWGFRASIIFTDTADTPKLKVKLNTPLKLGFGQAESVSVFGDLVAELLPFPIDSPMYLYLKRDFDIDQNPTFSLQFDTVPSEFSQRYLGMDMILGLYETTTTHPTWGTITSSSVDPSHPLNNLYKNDDNHFQGINGDLDLTITHQFPGKISGLCGYRLVFGTELIEQNLVPDQIKVTVTTRETVEGVNTDTEIITTELLDYYPAVRKDSTFVWEIVKFQDIDQPKNVTKVTINLKGTKSQVALAMSKFVMMFRGWQYNPYTGEASNRDKCPLGRIDMIQLPTTSQLTNAIVHRGCPQGTCLFYPVEHFNAVNKGTFKVTNVFGTSMIRAEIMATETNSIFSPLAKITNITEQDIFVEVINPGRYAVKVHRLW